MDWYTKLKETQAKLQSDHNDPYRIKCHCNHAKSECKFPDCNADRTPKWLSPSPPLPSHLMAH